MADNNKGRDSVIDLGKIFRKALVRKKLFFKVWGIVFIVATALILCVPRYYVTTSKLIPELGSSSFDASSLGSLVSSFGLDMGNMQSSDAISPLLYPDLMEDNAFVARLFKIRVQSADGEIDTDYYTYLRRHQKTPWWSKIIPWIEKLFKKKPVSGDIQSDLDPYRLNVSQTNIAFGIRGNIQLSVDKKTGVVSITTKAQDPLICKTLADTIQTYLQEYIIDYRTSKARSDVAYYSELADSARAEYMDASVRYSRAADANRNSILESYRTMLTNLENDMQLKYSSYTMMMTQLQAAKAKVQERTPAFTILKGAEVPTRPAGPKRMLFVVAMLFLATVVTVLYTIKDDLLGST